VADAALYHKAVTTYTDALQSIGEKLIDR